MALQYDGPDGPPWNELESEVDVTFPPGDEVDWHTHPAASARLLIERVSRRFEGFNPGDLESLGLSWRDVVTYRDAIRAALLGLVRDGGSGPPTRRRHTAVAYLGALGVAEATDVLAGVATSVDDPPDVRGLSVEALARLDDTDLDLIGTALDDPDATVRERAVRSLALRGAPREVLARVARRDVDAEVRRVARTAASQSAEKPPRRRGRLVTAPSAPRPIGRGLVMQTEGMVPEGAAAFGGRDLVSEGRLAAVRSDGTTSIGYEVLDSPAGFVRLRLLGDLASVLQPLERVRRWASSIDDVVFDVPEDMLIPGQVLPVRRCGCEPIDLPRWTPEGPGSAAVTGIHIAEGAVWVGRGFSLVVTFSAPSDAPVVLVRLEVEMPDGRGAEVLVEVAERERAAGRTVVEGFVSGLAGPVRVVATAYTEAGGAGWRSHTSVALPTNPISLSISPTTTGRNNKGPAHFNAAEDRFYCYATGRVVNGFPRRVTVGPAVTCRITDGGALIDSFGFSIGTFTVAANSWSGINMYVWLGVGTATHGVFSAHGDVRIEFTIATSEGLVSASAVWIAMAKVDLALNFVGNFTDARRFAAQAAVENEASAILEAQNLYIGDTWTFVLPSSHPDFGRFRDIRMNDNKDHDCTAGASEADDLRRGWSSPNRDWLDVWFVESLSGPACAANVLGFSPVEGPTEKDSINSGFVIRMDGADFTTDAGRRYFGLTVAHELGHYLGLEHITDDATNFMAPSNSLTNTAVRFSQFLDMADHPFVHQFTP